MTARAVLAALALSLLAAGCFPMGAQELVTPSTPMTYAWGMAWKGDDPHAWLVQVGPKVDADGTHLAVYGWDRDRGVEIFQEFDELAPGQHVRVDLVWLPGGWLILADVGNGWRVLPITVDVGPRGPIAYGTDSGEHTTQ